MNITYSLLACCSLGLLCGSGVAIGQTTSQGLRPGRALRDYVAQPDPAYSWKIVRKRSSKAGAEFVIELTSQKWLTQKEVDRPTWKHWLTVVSPKNLHSTSAFLMIGGGANGGQAPQNSNGRLMQIAALSGSVAAELKMVPNQPLVFHNDGERRVEDDLIGYAWDQYLKTGDAHWLPRLPMVKSAVRAMDCIQELLASEEGGRKKIERFTVAGGSKRGWTTWMTGTADKRVEAIVPIVIDVLNVDASMRHHAQVYGFWATAIGNYVQHGITEQWNHPRMKNLHREVDPYYHRDRLKMPKLIVNAAGDQFFVPDSSQFYYADLQGEKHLRYVPNADHSLRGSDAMETIIAFQRLVVQNKPRPRYRWKQLADGSLEVQTKDAPREVRLWEATNPKARDFRLKTIGRSYSSQLLKPVRPGVYRARRGAPEKGWRAWFIELTYDTGGPPLKFTTAVRVSPDRLPHKGIDVNKTPYEQHVGKPKR